MSQHDISEIMSGHHHQDLMHDFCFLPVEYTASKIEKIRQKLPKLGPLTKALQIHEIMITSDGQVRSKNLPSDVFYENVKIKESRRIQSVDGDV